MTLANTIQKMISAANALEAPLFGLDLLLRGAEGIAAERGKASIDDGSILYTLTGQPETSELDADEDIILKAAEAAFAFVTCRFLPDELALYRERDDANELIRSGYTVAKRYA